ncbi:hypothetical protein BOTBODRAFT_36503 [Botryobasidium botryosum FD-172 SS1]|uniref:Heterokaryon incompatibility domain-containing protein n=1 Tax=Botryobasidium botryosum (strain FD-172 SS1) TaxID=930990 RepID=A0A067M3B3_BOTB1|nr:hypothetical protein BOTBODRAFT_36503 [Botryobasidium botryosum FD-172 SS1]
MSLPASNHSVPKSQRPYSIKYHELLQESSNFLDWENKHCVYRTTLSHLKDKTLSITNYTPCRFRLIDCIQLAHHDKFRIYELTDVSYIPYSAISYVWKSDHDSPHQPRGTFGVEGALDGDPISIDVLMHACRASIMSGARYMWMDRLCIIQTSRVDKNWQIKNMHRVYSACSICLILPDGVGHLADAEKETSWIKRGWTLQEAVAPKKEPLVLFSWKHGTGHLKDEPDYDNPLMENEETWWLSIIEVTPRRCAQCSIRDLLHLTAYQFRDLLFFYPRDLSRARMRVAKPVVLGSSECRLSPLRDAFSPRREEGRAAAIWRSAITRASSRPVDMIFSIMGLFGVTLEVGDFHKDDRVGATVALMKAIVQNGGKPSWLLISRTLPPCRFLSSFPEFPTTKETGEVTIRSHHGEAPVEELLDFDAFYDCRDLVEAISMDDEGYLTINCQAAPVARLQDHEHVQGASGGILIKTADEMRWEALPNQFQGSERHAGRQAYAVIIGMDDVWGDTSRMIGVLVEQHAPERFHRISSFELTPDEEIEMAIQSWDRKNFSIGGPDPLPRPGLVEGAVNKIEKEETPSEIDARTPRLPLGSKIALIVVFVIWLLW